MLFRHGMLIRHINKQKRSQMAPFLFIDMIYFLMRGFVFPFT